MAITWLITVFLFPQGNEDIGRTDLMSEIVMPDLIRHPKHIEITEFSDKSENDEKWCFLTFYGTIKSYLLPLSYHLNSLGIKHVIIQSCHTDFFSVDCTEKNAERRNQ
ncbi:MAG: hypothetical protein JRJ15_13450 [Deltaproteobacteria bacterium]|nr:hypothetical protein [Deltaproteobacteria bacterium]